MKKWLKITLGVIGGFGLLLVIDLVCIFATWPETYLEKY